MGTERDNTVRRNTGGEEGHVLTRKGESVEMERDESGTSEKTRRDGLAVIISDNHPEKLRNTSSFLPIFLVSSVFSIRIRIKIL